MKKHWIAVLLFAALPAAAQTFSVTPSVSTLGYGGSIGARFGVVGLRVMGNTGSYSRDFQKEDIKFNGKLKLNNVGGIVDLYAGGGFHVSGGIFSNKNHVDLISDKNQIITVNGRPYPAALIGYVTGQATVSKNSPYAGIGWGHSGKGIGLTFDVGALYHGSPKLAVQAHPTQPALVPASFYADLEAERAKTENDIRSYKYHPVVTIGLTFGF
ncbi:MAG TPA: hypothetical protein VLU46_11015 [Thermoanaerobaculia bacterium]|nr:hypothetical protein [Thermoanaerobaculia bacterium]